MGPTKKRNKNQMGWRRRTERREVREIFFNLFILFVSFSDLWKSDHRNSSGKERKVFYATRATREYQKHEISPRIQVKKFGKSKCLVFLRFTAF